MKHLATKVRRGFSLLAMVASIMLVLSTCGIPLVREEITYEASAAPFQGDSAATVEMDIDFVRMLPSSPLFVSTFHEETDLTVVWDQTSTTGTDFVEDLGLCTMVASSETHFMRENLTITGTSLLVEMMFQVDTNGGTGDATYLKIEDYADKSFVAIGYRDQNFSTTYSNATGVQTYSDVTGLAADTWYIGQIYVNGNSTIDTEIRLKTTYALITSGHTHLTGHNITLPSEIDGVWVNNTGTTANEVDYEYVFVSESNARGEGPTATSANFVNIVPEQTKIQKQMFKESIDVEKALDAIWDGSTGTVTRTRAYENMSGGANVTAAIRAYDTSIPTSLAVATDDHSSESFWSANDVGEIAQLYSEQNISIEHVDVTDIYVFEFASSNFEQAVKNVWIEQYMPKTSGHEDDTDYSETSTHPDGHVVDYKLTDIFVVIKASDSLIERIQDDFWEGVEGSDATVETWSWPSIDFGGATKGLTGTGAEIKDAIGDGISNVWGGSAGFGAMMRESAANLVSDGIGGFTGGVKNVFSDGWTMTNSFIGSAIKGSTSFVYSMAGALWNGALSMFGGALSWMFGGVMQMFTIGIVIIIIIVIVAIVAAMAFGVGPAKFLVGKRSRRKST